jgi:hypothetical protein
MANRPNMTRKLVDEPPIRQKIPREFPGFLKITEEGI